MPKFSKEVRDVLFGDPFGEVLPKRESPPSPVYDGRTAALRILKKYFSELVFFRAGGKDQNGDPKDPIGFQIPARDIHVEWPDEEDDLHLPSLAFLAQEPAIYDAIGLTCFVEETSVDVFGPGTVLMWMSEYQEKFVVEIWAETKSQRRALIAGLEQALSPIQQMAGIRFRMPDYFDQLVCFELQTRELVDDEQSTLVRRKAKLVIELRYNVVALVNVVSLQPIVTLQTDVDEDTNELLGLLSTDPPERVPEDE